MVIKQPGLGECSQLCDVYQMEHVCELVSSEFHMARNGSKSGLTESLQELLIAPLRRYLFTLVARGSRGSPSGVRMEVDPTLDLIAAAEAVISRIRVGPWEDEHAQAATVALRCSWSLWIAYVASYWLTFEVPKRLAEQQVQREHGRDGGKTPKQGSQRSVDVAAEIVRLYAELQKRMEPHLIAGAVGLQVGRTPTWVRRVWRNHLTTKAKQQASL